MAVAEVGQGAVEPGPTGSDGQCWTADTRRRVALNISLSLLVLIGATFLRDLSTFVKALVAAASLCPAFIGWILSLYTQDFKKEARTFLESRSCTWSLAF